MIVRLSPLNTIPRRVMGRLFPRSRFGPSAYRIGPFITFKEVGFAAAPSLPALMARHYYETKYLREELESLRNLAGYRMRKSLEIGCGFARLSPYVSEYFEQHHAIDINPGILDTARDNYPNISFREASVTSLPYEDGEFDLIVTWTVLQHIPPTHIDGAIQEMRRVLSSNAALILCEATRFPGPVNGHTQDRPEGFYKDAFAPLRLVRSTDFHEIDKLPGQATPGRFMVFRA
jgi:SAM-dependent methyltransferase